MRDGQKICIKHFEDRFINEEKTAISDKSVPTLYLKSGSTLVDYEELLSQKPPKKKRGTSGLMNLQIARKKKLMRRERMQKLAEQRRLAKLMNGNSKEAKKKSEAIISYDKNTTDLLLGDDRTETESEKLIISLRLTNLMHQLHDNKVILTKHPSSIRDIKQFPIFNKIKDIQELINNPIYWTKEQVLIFVEKIASQKNHCLKILRNEELDGEAILNLTQNDLKLYFNFDEDTSKILGQAFQKLRKETIMRYVNS